MYPTFNPNMPQHAQDQVSARRPAFPQAGGMPQTFPGSGAFQGQGGPFAATGLAPGAPGAFPGQAQNGFQGQGGPFAQPPQSGMNAQVMPPNYQQGMNQAMRPPMPAQAQNPYLATNLGFGRTR